MLENSDGPDGASFLVLILILVFGFTFSTVFVRAHVYCVFWCKFSIFGKKRRFLLAQARIDHMSAVKPTLYWGGTRDNPSICAPRAIVQWW